MSEQGIPPGETTSAPGDSTPPSPPGAPGGPPPPSPPGAPDQPNTQLLLLKDKVQRYLADLVGPIQLAPDGAFTFQSGSARVFVRCVSWGTDNTLVGVSAPVLFEVQPSPDLYEHIATHGDDYLFGHLSAAAQQDGSVTVMFTHTLLGDYIDPDELKHAVGGVISVADQIDDDLKTRFGGKRFHDDVA